MNQRSYPSHYGFFNLTLYALARTSQFPAVVLGATALWLLVNAAVAVQPAAAPEVSVNLT